MADSLETSEALAELERVLASRFFRSADRLSGFLRFVVGKALNGEAGSLKEYCIGAIVFERGEDFDPRVDPIVRVEAGRLRLRLKEYYAGEGAANPLRIELPKGAYVPRIERTAVPAQPPPGSGPYVRCVAVMPFEDLSAGKDREHFCDGMTEELIVALTKVPSLRVVACPSSLRLRGRAFDWDERARELGVDTALTGSVRISGSRARITAQLMRVPDRIYLWSDTFERELVDVFTIQEEITKAIVETLEVRLAGGGTSLLRPHTADLTAYELYLKGRYQWNLRTPGGLWKSVEHFELAIAVDNGYALAHAGLADACTLLANYGAAPPADVRPKARIAALRAVELNGNLAESRAALAHVFATCDWDWEGAEREYERAIALNPGYAAAHHWYAITTLAPLGRLEEAAAEIDRAHEIDPISPSINRDAGLIAYYRRQHARAIHRLHEAIRLDARFPSGFWALGIALEQVEAWGEAERALTEAVRLAPDEPRYIASLGRCHGRMGEQAKAEDGLRRLEALAVNRYVSPFNFALLRLGMNDIEEARAWLDQAAAVRSYELITMPIDPRFDGMVWRAAPALSKTTGP